MSEPIDHIRKSLIKKSPDLIDFGKLPPQSIDLERAVLGALMIEKSAIDEVAEIIKAPEVFYKDQHIRIWNAIRDLFYANEPIDLLTVTVGIS